MKVTIVTGEEMTPEIGVQSAYEIKIGSLVVFGAPENDAERAAYTGIVTDITEPDADYDDELGRAVEYCPRVTVKFDDDSTEIASTYNVTRHTWASSYPDGPEEMIYQADDLELAQPSNPYERVAAAYSMAYGEPLVADAEWVMPLYSTCEAAVACDPSLDEGVDLGAVTVDRTAAVIHVITYGLPEQA